MRNWEEDAQVPGDVPSLEALAAKIFAATRNIGLLQDDVREARACLEAAEAFYQAMAEFHEEEG
jgi:hypothetical protein